MSRQPKPIEKRCVNVPSWSLPTETIEAVKMVAKAKNVSESAVLKDALSKYFTPSNERINNE